MTYVEYNDLKSDGMHSTISKTGFVQPFFFKQRLHSGSTPDTAGSDLWELNRLPRKQDCSKPLGLNCQGM